MKTWKERSGVRELKRKTRRAEIEKEREEFERGRLQREVEMQFESLEESSRSSS